MAPTARAATSGQPQPARRVILEHKLTRTPLQIGIGEELMRIEAENGDTAQAIEAILADEEAVSATRGKVKPELMRSVLEICTDPSQNLAEATEQIADMRRCVAGAARRHGMLVAAAGTHPWADRKSTRLNSSHGNISSAVFFMHR